MNDKERAEYRLKRQKERKRKKAAKSFLFFLAIIVLMAAAFLITVKICDPDFEVASLLPKEKVQQAAVFVNEEVLGKTTTKPETTKKKTVTTTKPENYDYETFDDFAFNTSLQGNQVGNLLNKTKGTVTYSPAYIYYSVDGKGIYRFEPNEETNAKVNVDGGKYRYLNVLGDYIYFVDIKTDKLKKAAVSGGSLSVVSENIAFAYLYNDKIYFVGTDNTIGYIDTSDNEKTVLHSASADKKIKFVGVSLSRVFFTEYDEVTKNYTYITVSLEDKNDKRYFMDETVGDEIKNIQLECGYFYYYEKNSGGKFSLMRKKFGSDKTVILLQDCNMTDYPVVYANRLYYSEKDSGKMTAKELNMNSKDIKTMLSVSNADESGSMGVGYGYQYVFLFGTRRDGESRIYKGSCIYTSASSDNTLTFRDGSFKY